MKAALALFSVQFAGLASAADTPPISLLYEERPPYQMRVGHAVEGLVASRAADVFRKAGVAFVWETSSMSRQMQVLRDGQPHRCVIGWFKNAERASFANFTLPIYRDSRIVGITRSGFSLVPGNTLEQALTTPGLRVLVRAKYSYGATIDAMFRRIAPALTSSNLPNTKLVELVRAGRADLMLASEEEAQVLVRPPQASAASLAMHPFADVAQGIERHIACSRQVPGAVIERLNKAIASKPGS